LAASTHPVKSNGIYSIKYMGTKLAAPVEEKEESLQSKDKEHQIQQMRMRVHALVRERDAARYEMERVIKQIECFHCFGDENDRHVFISCGHMVFSDCKEKYAMGTPCPKCQVKIIGHLQLFN
jgi:phosphomannomutase